VRKDDADQQQANNNADGQWFEINDSSTSAVNSSKVCSRSGYLLFYHSNSCQCNHFTELTTILDTKMAMSMDKKLAKEGAQEPDVSQQFEVADNSATEVTGELVSQPHESSTNNRKAKREDSSENMLAHKKQKRNPNGPGNIRLSERRCMNGKPFENDGRLEENHFRLQYDGENGSVSKGPPTPLRNTIMCILCNSYVASVEDEYVDHLFQKHGEQEALFVLDALGHGENNNMDFQLNNEPNQVDMLAINEALNSSDVHTSEPTNNQIVQLVQNHVSNQKFNNSG
jgi:hypothetical protein